MRPNKQETDLEYWSKAIQHWKEVEEFWWMNDNSEGEKRAQQRRFQAELAFQEAQGLIEVYSGRANPKWSNPQVQMAKPVGNRLTAFSL